MGDKVITVGDIEDELAKIPPQFLSHFNDPVRKQQYIQSIVDRMVFAEEAKVQRVHGARGREGEDRLLCRDGSSTRNT